MNMIYNRQIHKHNILLAYISIGYPLIIILEWKPESIITRYRQTSNISRTKSQTLNVSCLVLQLSLPNPLKPGVKSRMKM